MPNLFRHPIDRQRNDRLKLHNGLLSAWDAEINSA